MKSETLVSIDWLIFWVWSSSNERRLQKSPPLAQAVLVQTPLLALHSLSMTANYEISTCFLVLSDCPSLCWQMVLKWLTFLNIAYHDVI